MTNTILHTAKKFCDELMTYPILHLTELKYIWSSRGLVY